MTTKTVTIKSDEYTKLTSAASFLIQARGELHIIVKVAKPEQNDMYIRLNNSEVITHNQVSGTIWGISAEDNTTSMVSVTE